MKAIIDLDLYKYHASAAGEKRSIIVTHKISGRTKQFDTRTEFYGRDKNKSGGWLGELNSKRTSPFTLDEFDIEDKQVADPIANILHTAKLMVEKDLAACGAKTYKAFLGEGDSFRLGLSTIKKYKDRDHLIKPIHLQEVTEYLGKKYKAEIVTGIESDDAVVIECFGDEDSFGLIEDKDYWGQPMKVWDRNQQHRGIVDCNKFGHLFLDDKGKVRGEGEIFLLFQIASSDAADNYAANSASDIRWGEKSAYKRLQEATDLSQAKQIMVDIYKYLYPEPKTIIGWRGDEIDIDWKYVLIENFNMARMKTSKDDKLTFDEWMGDVKV